jgi:P pilus assembly chaperone PapD
MTKLRVARTALKLFLPALLFVPTAAEAELALSQMIVDLQPGKASRQDIEVWNNSPDNAYVAVEPSEILNPGSGSEARRQDPNPESLGLLVSPARLVLDPGQRKLVRLASIVPATDRERVYRVTIKPVVGVIASDQSGLKILVGYDVLVLVRPAQQRAEVAATRSGDTMTFHNGGNVSVELIEGKECDPSGKICSELAGKRLYAGADWSLQLKPGRRPEYLLKSPEQSVRKSF